MGRCVMNNIPVENCCGCTACSSICPKEAIQMVPDSEGFAYPVILEDRCVSCGLCEQVCPILHAPPLTEKYETCVVAQHTNDEVLNQCTSGGFIDALYEHVLEKNHGYAAGVAFDEHFMPVHLVTDRYEKAKEFRNSKYAQSDMNGVFREIRGLLQQNRQVLFVGTPCQVAGLKCYLRKEYDNLLTADLVCRSIPSPKLWKEYLKWQEEKHRDKIVEVACRKKTYGYHSGALEIRFARGRKYCGSNRVDYFMKSFHHDICSRPSCYQCAFKTEHRCSDFTVFDSWNPEMVTLEPMVDNDRGYSNVLVHTQKGKRILEQLDNIRCDLADPKKMFRYTGAMERQSIRYPEERKTFYTDLNCLKFAKTTKKYVSVTWLDRAIEKAKPIRYAIKKK